MEGSGQKRVGNRFVLNEVYYPLCRKRVCEGENEDEEGLGSCRSQASMADGGRTKMAEGIGSTGRNQYLCGISERTEKL